MKVLLIYPPMETALPGSFPLGPGYVSSVLLQAGHQVEVFDINAYQYDKTYVEERLISLLPTSDLVGISGMITVYSYIKWLATIIKKYSPETPIVVGGTIATSMPEFLLRKTMVDIACIGEGEITMPELIAALESSTELSSVHGIYYKEDGIIQRTPPRDFIHELDAIPFPAWDLFPMEIYIKNPLIVGGTSRSMNIIASRGCPYACTYCYRNFGRKVRLRSADNVLSEIKYLQQKYDVHHFEFQDELFIVDKQSIHQFCHRLLDEGIKITWRCLGRVNLVDIDTLKLMKSAGCHWIGYGLESASPKMLKVMNKRASVDEMKRAIVLTRAAGIEPSGTFMIGMPGETKETVDETVEFCKEMRIFNELFFTMPFPGTSLYDQLKQSGFISDDEAFILQMDKDVTNLLINMTNLSDDELMDLKEQAEKSILEYLRAGWRQLGFVEVLELMYKDAYDHYKYPGISACITRIFEIIRAEICRFVSKIVSINALRKCAVSRKNLFHFSTHPKWDDQSG